MTYIVAHDLGTSAHKAILTTRTGEIVACASEPLTITSAQEGWAEQSPDMWWAAVAKTTRTLLRTSGVPGKAVAAVSFTGQTQATVPMDAGGVPLCDALIWLDARASAQSQRVVRGWPRVSGYGLWRLLQWLHRTNGVPTRSGRDTLAKTLWLREERPSLWQRVHRILDAKDYLLLRCTGRYVTSYDCGHLTWLMDVRPHRRAWSSKLLAQVGLSQHLLPDLLPSVASAGPLLPGAAGDMALPAGIPVIVGASDIVSLAMGTGALAVGEASVGLGTSAWVSAHVRRHRVSVRTYTASIMSAFVDRPLVVAHQELGGGCVAWFLRMVRNHAEAAEPTSADYVWLQEAVRQTAPGAEGLLFTPWLAGEYAPLQDNRARGAFFGLGLQHHGAHLGRAVLEGVAYNLRWALQAVLALTRQATPHLRIAGGGAQSDAWCQIIADVCGLPVMRPSHVAYTTALGAARLAGLYLGAFADGDALQSGPAPCTVFTPNPAHAALYDAGFATFRRFYARTHTLARAMLPLGHQAHKSPFVAPVRAAHDGG